MTPAQSPTTQRAKANTGLQEATVVLAMGDGRFLLDDGGTSRQALSCLLVPQAGDRVAWLAGRDGERYLLHLLSRPEPGSFRLEVLGATELGLVAPKLALRASAQLSLSSMGDAEVSAPGGKLKLEVRNLTVTVLESLVQTARHMIGRYENWFSESRSLSRLHGKQTLVTAEQDVRVDGERISMG